MSLQPFVYRCRITRVIDGDTLVAVADLGFGLHLGIDARQPLHLRLLGVDTRELNARDPVVRALAVTDTALTTAWLAEHALHGGPLDPLDWPFLVATWKDDAFGRYLAAVWCWIEHSLTAHLLASGVPAWVNRS